MRRRATAGVVGDPWLAARSLDHYSRAGLHGESCGIFYRVSHSRRRHLWRNADDRTSARAITSSPRNGAPEKLNRITRASQRADRQEQERAQAEEGNKLAEISFLSLIVRDCGVLLRTLRESRTT